MPVVEAESGQPSLDQRPKATDREHPSCSGRTFSRENNERSATGPVRTNNEDYVELWRPPDAEEERRRGTIVLLADGIGGQGKGEVASKLAVETALGKFREARPDCKVTR